MKETEINLVLKLIEHARRDISYGAGGSFGDGDNVDMAEIRRVEKAIEIVKRLVIQAQKS